MRNENFNKTINDFRCLFKEMNLFFHNEEYKTKDFKYDEFCIPICNSLKEIKNTMKIKNYYESDMMLFWQTIDYEQEFFKLILLMANRSVSVYANFALFLNCICQMLDFIFNKNNKKKEIEKILIDNETKKIFIKAKKIFLNDTPYEDSEFEIIHFIDELTRFLYFLRNIFVHNSINWKCENLSKVLTFMSKFYKCDFEKILKIGENKIYLMGDEAPFFDELKKIKFKCLSRKFKKIKYQIEEKFLINFELKIMGNFYEKKTQKTPIFYIELDHYELFKIFNFCNVIIEIYIKLILKKSNELVKFQ